MVYKRLFSLSITVIMDLPIKRLLGSFGAIWKNMIKPRNICVALWTKRVLFHIDNKMTVKEKKDFSFQDRFDLNENKITKYIIISIQLYKKNSRLSLIEYKFISNSIIGIVIIGKFEIGPISPQCCIAICFIMIDAPFSSCIFTRIYILSSHSN